MQPNQLPGAISNIGKVPQGAQAEAVETWLYDTFTIGVNTALPAEYKLFQRGTGKSTYYQNFTLPAEQTVGYRITHIRAVADIRFSAPANALAAEKYFEDNTLIKMTNEDKVNPSFSLSELLDYNKIVNNGAYAVRNKVTNKYQLKDPIEIGGNTRVEFSILFPQGLTTALTGVTNPYLGGSNGLASGVTEGFSLRIILYGIQYRLVR